MPVPQASQPACFMPCLGHICCQLGWEAVGFLCAGEQGEGKGWSARPIFSVLEDNFGWTGRNSSCHAGSLLSSKSSTTFAAPSCFLHPDFFSFNSNRMRFWLWFWHCGTCKCCQEPGRLLVRLLLEGWLQLSISYSTSKYPWNTPTKLPQSSLSLAALQWHSSPLPAFTCELQSSAPGHLGMPLTPCTSPSTPCFPRHPNCFASWPLRSLILTQQGLSSDLVSCLYQVFNLSMAHLFSCWTHTKSPLTEMYVCTSIAPYLT